MLSPGFDSQFPKAAFTKLSLQFWKIKVKTEGAVRTMSHRKVLEKWPPLLLPNFKKIPVLVGIACLAKLSLQS